MPLFDLQCKKCGAIRPDVMLTTYTSIVSKRCTNCGGRKFETLAPLTAMQPDNMWSGTDTRFGHFTSKSQYNKLLKDRSIESISKKELDTVRKNVYNAKQDRLNKIEEKRKDFLNQELTNVEISPDGNTIKERNKYVRKRQ